MPDGFEIASELLPDMELIRTLHLDLETAEKTAALARIRARAQTSRAGLMRQSEDFDRMYEEAERRLPAEGLIRLAEKVRESELGALELVQPWIVALRHAVEKTTGLDAVSREGRELLNELIKISEAWLAQYRDVRERLRKLARERSGPAVGVLRARPVKGKLDHAAVTREIIARYPKILAALAE